MLLLGPSSSVAQRIQGAWVDENEVRQVVESWAAQARAMVKATEAAEHAHDPTGPVDVTTAAPVPDMITGDASRPAVGGSPAEDDLFEQARHLVVSSQLGSTSMLQRKLRVGFARAGRLMDLMEEAGVVGPSTGSKAREVLVSLEQLDNHQGQGY
tara:strand:- start:849 stop:1313 length:465 start_codon:yes stop_codon:yes gene_type:complete